MRGKVYLVGAGSGEVGLLTLRGRELIDSCDVIVYDRLVGQDILDLIPEDTLCYDVGKTAGHHPVPQEEIENILVREAKEGKNVLRLKGGDNFIYGRGAEELERLVEERIPYEVVPGIPALVAATAYAGIPLTHRDYASGFHVFTGHKRAGTELDFDYDSMAKLKGTLVFFMALKNSKEIIDGLLAAGMDPDLPCCAIEDGTLPSQRRICAPLKDFAQVIVEEEVKSPALLLLGSVCELATKLDWFYRRPLYGKRLLVTRTQKGSSSLLRRLKELGAEVDLCPLIEIQPRSFELPDPDSFEVLIFTSANGIHFFLDQWMKERDARSFANKFIATVGPMTAKALKDYGLSSDFVPTIYTGLDLGKELLERGLVQGKSTLCVRGQKTGGDLGRLLQNEDFSELIVYDTALLEQTPEKIERYDYICFTSSSAVESFSKVFTGDPSTIRALCIGPKTMETAEAEGYICEMPPVATIDSMVDYLIEKYWEV